MLFENPDKNVAKKIKITTNFTWRVLIMSLMLFFPLFGFNHIAGASTAINNSEDQKLENSLKESNLTPASIENRFENIEKTLQSIKTTGEKAEDRSYFNKMASTEVIRYLKIMVLLLVLIALGFPLAIWIINRSGSGDSSRSQELAQTLLTVEERQAKLVNILKEIQGEIDYLHTMSAPDLRNLIQQAESYLKMNEEDLHKADSKSESPKKQSTKQ